MVSVGIMFSYKVLPRVLLCNVYIHDGASLAGIIGSHSANINVYSLIISVPCSSLFM